LNDLSWAYKLLKINKILYIPKNETQVLALARQLLYYLSHSTSPVFVLGILEIGSHQLSAGIGTEQ
jgi:hypothetical protein